jgi:AbrB family looped-hinge helix DNA binding protein
MRITSKGQVTIPVAMREKAGLLPHTEVEFELDGDAVRIVRARGAPKDTRKETRGERAVRLLRGSGTVRMTTDEIMTLMRGDWRDELEVS